MSASNDLEWVDSSVDNCKFKTEIPYRHKLLQNTHNFRHYMRDYTLYISATYYSTQLDEPSGKICKFMRNQSINNPFHVQILFVDLKKTRCFYKIRDKIN